MQQEESEVSYIFFASVAPQRIDFVLSCTSSQLTFFCYGVEFPSSE